MSRCASRTPNRRRWARRLLGTAGAVFGCALAVLAPAVEAHAARSPSPSPSATPPADADRTAITLRTLDPKVVHPRDTITLSGVVTNTSDDALRNVTVWVRASSDRIATRYDLAHDADPSTPVGVLISGTRQSIGTLAAGASAEWQISLPEQRLALPTGPDDFGAYPFAVEVRTTSTASGLAGRLPTTLMWLPDHAHFTRTDISWLVPVVDGVHRAAGDTFVDDSLAKDLSPSGRLGRLVAAANGVHLPLTYLVDPAVVDDAATMAGPAPTAAGSSAPVTGPRQRTDTSPAPTPAASGTPTASPTSQPSQATSKPTSGAKESAKESAKASGSAQPSATPYQVANGKITKAGTGTQVAATWLAALRAAVTSSGSSLVGLPYGDADLVALARAGLDKEIAIARSTGQSELGALLGAATSPGIVWPVDGMIDRTTLDDLASNLVDTVVLSDRALPPQNPDNVAGIRTDLQTASGTVRAVLADSAVGKLLSDPSSVAGGPRAAEQRFLAETMLITEQRPGSGSSLVVAPPREWNPGAFATTLLDDTATAPWLRPVTLHQVSVGAPDDVPRASLDYPDSARRAELPQSVLSQIPDLRARLTAFSSILAANTTEPFINTESVAILRAESSSLRTDPSRASQILSAVSSNVAHQTAKVFITDPRLITLTSRKQKIPITVVNNLPDPVTLRLQLNAVNAARLKVDPIAPFTVPGKGGRQELLVEVEATTGGRFEVQAQLLTPETQPQPYGTPISFELNSTAYGAVALAIAGTAAGVLVLLSAVRIVRRVRHGRGTDTPPDGGTPGTDTPPDGGTSGTDAPSDATVGS